MDESGNPAFALPIDTDVVFQVLDWSTAYARRGEPSRVDERYQIGIYQICQMFSWKDSKNRAEGAGAVAIHMMGAGGMIKAHADKYLPTLFSEIKGFFNAEDTLLALAKAQQMISYHCFALRGSVRATRYNCGVLAYNIAVVVSNVMLKIPPNERKGGIELAAQSLTDVEWKK